MLSHPTFEKLKQLRFRGMQQGVPDIDQMNFMDRLGVLVDCARKRTTTISPASECVHGRSGLPDPSRSGSMFSHAEEMVEKIMTRFIHPEQGSRSVLGTLSLSRVHGRTRVDALCATVLSLGGCSSRSVHAILKHEQTAFPESEESLLIHEHLQTGEYSATDST